MKEEKDYPCKQPVVLNRQYGQYQVKVCFAVQDESKVQDKVLGAIMQAYRMRLEREDSSRRASW